MCIRVSDRVLRRVYTSCLHGVPVHVCVLGCVQKCVGEVEEVHEVGEETLVDKMGGRGGWVGLGVGKGGGRAAVCVVWCGWVGEGRRGRGRGGGAWVGHCLS